MPRLTPSSAPIPEPRPQQPGQPLRITPELAAPQPAAASAATNQVQNVRKGTSQLNLAFIETPAEKPAAAPKPAVGAPAPAGAVKNINTPAVFFNANAATGKELDKVLKHYGSPHAGKGETIARICREQKINPILLVAVMQQESSYGNRSNRPSLKDENIANPWSVHFNEGAKGIAKLRLKDGSMPSFEQSLEGAIRSLKRLSAGSDTPLSTAGARYSETGSWSAEVTKHYETQLNRIAKGRG